jgi:hypothetical protein
MEKIKLEITVEVNDCYNLQDKESKEWFDNEVLAPTKDNLKLVSREVGDYIGDIIECKLKTKNTALLVSTEEEWEGLWINEKLYKQGHSINEGDNRGLFFLALAKKYKLTIDDFKCAYTNDLGDKYIYDNGQLPDDYDELQQYINVTQVIKDNIYIK